MGTRGVASHRAERAPGSAGSSNSGPTIPTLGTAATSADRDVEIATVEGEGVRGYHVVGIDGDPLAGDNLARSLRLGVERS